MDRKYAKLNDALADLRDHVREIQNVFFAQDRAAIDRLRRFEYVIFALVLVMVGAAALYGRKIKTQMEADVRDKAHSYQELREARDALEVRVAERTAELSLMYESLRAEFAKGEGIRAALDAREVQLNEAQAIAHVGSWEWDVLRNKVTWSAELYRIFGVAPHEFEVTYENYMSCIHPDDRQLVARMIQRALHEKQFYDFDHRIVRPDGTIRFMHSHGQVVTDANGVAVRMMGTGQDVTARKQTEEELERARDHALELVRLNIGRNTKPSPET